MIINKKFDKNLVFKTVGEVEAISSVEKNIYVSGPACPQTAIHC